MIDESNFSKVLEILHFTRNRNIYTKHYNDYNCDMIVDFDAKRMIYPDKIEGWERISKFSKKEFFVQFECVDRLLTKGYRPEHIEIEKSWRLGHDPSGGRGDVCVYNEDHTEMLIIIECKTAGREYKKAYDDTCADGGQLFPYWQQEEATKWLALYSSDYDGGVVKHDCSVISCDDDPNIVHLAKKDSSVHLYATAKTAPEKYDVWQETYGGELHDDLIFSEDTIAYKIGVKPLYKKDLKDFTPDDKIVNRFEEILRHNNVSDKENAFNRLIALFICKLVDELSKGDEDIVDFQYQHGTDTYESLQDRLQRLHQQGMKEFMKEDIFYVSNDYAENLFKAYTGKTRKRAIEDLNNTIRILKFYSNNDFAFKDVHNEELFYQNGKILVEVVQLFEKYRIVYASKHQFLGDLFEKLLNKGFKQNEGQFFTPMPITRFVWDSLPLENIMNSEENCKHPKVIDYACGAGHFLTEAIEAINDYHKKNGMDIDNSWVEKNVFGIEKDYRLARVSKVSMFMNGAGAANIVFGDGLENYPEKDITPESFDILVANPPYAVEAFKPHLNLKNNTFNVVGKVSNNGSEIETLFVERIAQLVKEKGIAAVILPNSILWKTNASFVAAREELLKNFRIHAIVQCGGKTFNATTAETAILFLEKYDKTPTRSKMIEDSVEEIFKLGDLEEWEDKIIFEKYINHIKHNIDEYKKFIGRTEVYTYWLGDDYFKSYVLEFKEQQYVKTKETQKSFLAMSDDEKIMWYNSEFYNYAHLAEKQKMMYFGLVYNQRTLIINASGSVNEQKMILGYDWKEGEGIQVFNPGGLMYSADNRDGKDTLACIVRNKYLGSETYIEKLKKYYCYKNLSDMMDFESNDFNKKISLVMETINSKSTKYKSEQLVKLMIKLRDVSITVKDSEIKENGEIPVISQAKGNEIAGYVDTEKYIDIGEVIVFGDHTCSVKYVNYPFVRGADGTQLVKVDEEKLRHKFLFYYLKHAKIENSDKYERHFKYVKQLWIPLPEISEQDKIIEQFDEIELRINDAERKIEELNDEIVSIFNRMFGGIPETVTIANYIGSFIAGKSLAGYEECENKVLKTSAVSYDHFIGEEYKYLPKDYSPNDKDKVCSGDVLISRMNTAELVGAVAYVWEDIENTYIPDRLWKAVLKDGTNPIFLWQLLIQKETKDKIHASATGTSASMKNISQKKFLNVKVKNVDSDLQNEFAGYVSLIIEKQKSVYKDLLVIKEEQRKLVDLYFEL